MKYTIEGFDQELLVKWGLDSNDAIILRWFVDFYLSGKMAKVEHDGETYLWVNYQTCIDDLPIMRIKNKEVLARHFKKFEQCGLMKRHISRKGGIYTCFKLVEKEYIKLIEKVERSTENRRVDFKVGNERPKSREDVDSKVETKDSSIIDPSFKIEDKEPNGSYHDSRISEFQKQWIKEYPGNYIVTNYGKWGKQIQTLLKAFDKIYNGEAYEKLVEC